MTLNIQLELPPERESGASGGISPGSVVIFVCGKTRA
jgi:hypothetical protein